MRRFLLALTVASIATAQVAVLGIPRIDAIEFFGLHHVSPALARQALGLSPGAPLPESKGEAEERLLDIDEVVSASLEAVCCDGGKNILYVGIEERDAEHFDVRPAPGGGSVLPDDILTAYRAYEQAWHTAELAGKINEDFSRGYALASDLPTRAAQQRFPALVDANLDLVREVLRDSGDGYHRGIAAYILPYAAKRAELVDDLREALTDAEPGVRAKAVHALTGLAILENADPASKVRVSGGLFLNMLQSIAWSDRMQAVLALETLTRDRDVVLLSRIRGPALESLFEMARWKTEAHAYPAFQLVGRVAGLSDFNIRDAWLRFGVETVIGQAQTAAR